MFEEILQLKTKISQNLIEVLELRNLLKQKEIEKQDLTREFFLGIIDIIDSYENKESSLLEKNHDNPESIKMINNFKVIKKKLITLLEKFGVTKVEFPEDRLIIGFSKVVGTEPDPNKKNDSIVSIVRNGYIRAHEVIREAELIIVKN